MLDHRTIRDVANPGRHPWFRIFTGVVQVTGGVLIVIATVWVTSPR